MICRYKCVQMAVELENGTENLLQQTRSKSAKLRGHSTAKKKKKWRDWKYSKVKNATAWKNELEKQIETEKNTWKRWVEHSGLG